MAGEERKVENINSQIESASEKENEEESLIEETHNESIHSEDAETNGTEILKEVSQEVEDNDKVNLGSSSNDRLLKLPLSRIKTIMKSDPDVTLASQEAVITLTKAAELFIAALSKDAVVSTINCKRKTLQRKDLDIILDTRDGYAFLEGTLD